MLKLMKLELKKFGIRIKGVILANLIILSTLLLTIFTGKVTDQITFRDYSGMFLSTGILVRGVFAIFAAVLISKLIISEYKNKTINIMFLYPIKRRKIMLAKLFIVIIFTFITMLLSNLFLDFSLYTLNIFVKFIKEPLTMDILLKNLINVTIYSVAYAFMNLIPVYVGMIKKSGTATIVSAIIIVSIFNSGSGSFSLSSFIIIPIIGAILGVISSYMAIKDIEEVDVIS